MIKKYIEKLKKIDKEIRAIKTEANNGIIKDASLRDSPILFNSSDFQSNSIEEDNGIIDPFSTDKKMIERRNNILGYCSDIMDIFDNKYFKE